MTSNNPFDVVNRGESPQPSDSTPSSPFDDAFAEEDLSAPPRAASSAQRTARGVRIVPNNGARAVHIDAKGGSRDPEVVSLDTVDSDVALADHHEFEHKRSRWGTHREPRNRGRLSRKSSRLGRQVSQMFHIGDNHHQQKHHGSRANHKRNASQDDAGSKLFAARSDSEDDSADLKAHEELSPTGETSRRVYFNRPLPREMLDEHGAPLAQFSRNKIRTTKYTPLSFIPKNLIFQFKNVANIYFLFIVILGAFPIFGVQNPGLAAVPIVVIVIITMIKDAIEDYRRTLMDLEVNNGMTEILDHYENPNVVDDRVSFWRRFKKANTRLMMRFARWVEKKNADRIEKKTGTRPARHQAFNQELIVASDLASIYSRESFDLGERRRHSVNTIQQPERDPGTIIDPTLRVMADTRFKPDFWKNVKVGDFVRVRSDQEIPADLVILSTSEEDGACYVETKNLDGETNLKIRQALHCGRSIRRSSDCQQADFWLESEPPMPNLYSYHGAVKWQTGPNSDEVKTEPVNINNVVLRGCTLRNTKWMIGVVVFTGPDSKIMLNTGNTPTKRSFIQKHLNMLVIYNFALLFILCFIGGLVNGIMRRDKRSTFALFEFGAPASTTAANGVVTFWAALILYQSLVPISLYISIEIVKTVQAFFIYSDVYMYHEPIDYPCTPKTWNISDDLGQIEYIFSDKTGTLTQNVMEFKKCTVNGVAYGKAYTEALAGLRKREGVNIDAEAREMAVKIKKDKLAMIEGLQKLSNNPQRLDEEITFVSNAYVEDLQGAHGKTQAEATHYFMLCLALCNSVITEKGLTGRNDFKAQSPDEAALVSTARDMGFALLERTRRGLLLDVRGQQIEFPLLNILEFNSTRKRMSAIVKMPDTGKIFLICKGADSVIYSRLVPGAQEELRKTTAVHLEEFANEGLRTLCIAQREISQKEYSEFSRQYDIAAAEIVDREHKLEEVCSKIERDMVLLGGTAIEDRLQEGVPRTIQLLGDGGIKLWVLTGDKVETAINIGFSCNLLTNDMQLLTIKVENNDKGSVPAQIDEFLFRNFGMEGSFEELEAAKSDHSVPISPFAVIIDGDALKLALNPVIRHKFLLLCKQCRAVLCCRVSPAQKASVVRMVRTSLDVITLSIGDGANDVAMIQEANVGIGIAGEEGRQAVMSSDYAIGQFRFLARLLLVHGRYSYRRLAEMIPNFFYKNIVFTLTLFWYGIFSDFDATYLYDYTYLMFFNLAFTSLPVIFMGILDQDIPDRISLAVPQLYRRGILRKDFTERKFWLYMGEGFYQSFVCFFFPYFCYSDGRFVDPNGHPANHRFWMGLASCSLSVMSCNLYVITNQYRWDWVSVVVNVISTLVVWIWTGIYCSFVASGEVYGMASGMYGTLIFWAVVLLGSLTCMVFHFMFMTIRAFLEPQDVDIIREQWRLGEFDTVMATPLAADDPDAAHYQNPYRPDTHMPQKDPVGFMRRRRRNKQPYEIPLETHQDIMRSPDFIRVGNKEFEAEEYQWGSPPQSPFTDQSPKPSATRQNIGSPSGTAHDLANRSAPEELRRSLDHARRTSRWEQSPQMGIGNIETTLGLEEELTTAVGLMGSQRDKPDSEN
nr:Dnf1 [Starmerella bombicola]